MQLSIEELLFLASSAIILPVIAVLTITFFMGGLTRTESAKFVVVAEPEEDYWTLRDADVPQPRASAPAHPAAPDSREGEQG
jgi:hypothetical protein